MIGRSEAVEQLAALLPERRFVTIAGPGGMGKTTVALAVAERLFGVLAMVCASSTWHRSRRIKGRECCRDRTGDL